MRSPYRVAGVAVLLVAYFYPASAQATTAAEEIGAMVKKMYAYPVNVFEYGEFNGRRNDSKACALARQFFVSAMLVDGGKPNCRYKGSRFAPDAGGTPMEEVVTADGMDLPPPIPFVQTIKVQEDEAQVDILFGDAQASTHRAPSLRRNKGRVVFFLRKRPSGWRITNKLSFRIWPLLLDGENSDCRMASIKYEFALKPQALSELSPLPPACQTVEKAYYFK